MNRIKTRALRASRQVLEPSPALASDLSLMARLEGKPIPTMQELAVLLDVSTTTAFRLVARLKRSGMLKLVDRVQLPADVCQCISNLRTRLTDKAAVDQLEARLRSDPFVSIAAAVTGRYSYRVSSLHKDASSANVWFRALLTEPAVLDGALILSRPIIDRSYYAQALIGGRPDIGSRSPVQVLDR